MTANTALPWVTCLVLLGLLLMGIGGRREVDLLRAQRIEIVDADGNVVAVLSGERGFGEVSTQTIDGKGLFSLGMTADRAGLLSLRRQGVPMVELRTTKTGAGVVLTYRGGRPLVEVGSAGTAAAVTLHDEAGRPIIKLGPDAERGAGQVVTLGQGEPQISLGPTAEGAGSIETFNASGRPLVAITADRTSGGGAIGVYDDRGKIRASVP